MRAREDGGRTGSLLWRLVRLAVRVFYRVERVGPSVPGGAVVLVANHPNTLLDPSVIQATTGRPVRFLAKSTLFRSPVLGAIIRRSGAIPIYRKMDAGADTSRNAEIFAAVQDALAGQDAICPFPEGISPVSGRLEPLRSGAARLVLTSAAAGCPVTVVPVGLSFDRLPMFRSRVVAIFGQPFDAADLVDLFGRDPVGAVRAFGFRDRDLDRRMPAGAVVRFLLREGARAVVLVPFAVVGVCGFAPPYWLTWAFSLSAPDLQIRATWKIIGGWWSMRSGWEHWPPQWKCGPGLERGFSPDWGSRCWRSPDWLHSSVRPQPSSSCVRFLPADKLRCARASLKRQRAAIATVLDRTQDWLESRPGG